MRCKLQPLTEKELDLVLRWRNSDRVRNAMFNNQLITYDEHMNWFNSITNSESEKYLIFYISEVPMGLVSIKELNLNDMNCTWGFYIGEDSAPKGSGLALGYLGLTYAFNTLNLKKVYGEVLSDNVASIKFHEKLGFVSDGVTRQLVRKKDTYIDILRYSLLQVKWSDKKETIHSHLLRRGFDVINFKPARNLI